MIVDVTDLTVLPHTAENQMEPNLLSQNADLV